MSRVSDSVRQQVRQRAGNRGEYCRRPEGFGFFSHQVDHIIAIKHGGSDEPENLAWACFHCNNGKGSDLTSIDSETNNRIVPLFNPRMQTWEDHFKLDGAQIAGITPTGWVTVKLLEMNSANQIEIRERLMKAGEW